MRQKQVKLDIYQFVATNTAQKMNFSIKDFFNKCDHAQEILNGKLPFLRSVII